MKPRREKIITYQQVVVPIPKKTILGDSPMDLGHWSASLDYNSLIFKDLHVVPKEPHPNQLVNKGLIMSVDDVCVFVKKFITQSFSFIKSWSRIDFGGKNEKMGISQLFQLVREPIAIRTAVK
jgi:hypothetical protein